MKGTIKTPQWSLKWVTRGMLTLEKLPRLRGREELDYITLRRTPQVQRTQPQRVVVRLLDTLSGWAV